jgi:hypothetical protein
MMAGNLPPHSNDSLASRLAARSMIRIPVFVLPVKEILSTPELSTSASPVGCPGPLSRFTTPAGKAPLSWTASISAAVEAGVTSDDLTTAVQPAARAAPSLRTARSTGSFHGMMSAATPAGSGRTMSQISGNVEPVTCPSRKRAAPAK